MKLETLKENFKSDLKKLRLILILLTLIQIGYAILLLVNTTLLAKLDSNYYLNWFLWGLNFLVAGHFLWFNWSKMPIKKATKINNTFLILLLGIIGMWLWFPSKREIKKMLEN